MHIGDNAGCLRRQIEAELQTDKASGLLVNRGRYIADHLRRDVNDEIFRRRPLAVLVGDVIVHAMGVQPSSARALRSGQLLRHITGDPVRRMPAG